MLQFGKKNSHPCPAVFPCILMSLKLLWAFLNLFFYFVVTNNQKMKEKWRHKHGFATPHGVQKMSLLCFSKFLLRSSSPRIGKGDPISFMFKWTIWDSWSLHNPGKLEYLVYGNNSETAHRRSPLANPETMALLFSTPIPTAQTLPAGPLPKLQHWGLIWCPHANTPAVAWPPPDLVWIQTLPLFCLVVSRNPTASGTGQLSSPSPSSLPHSSSPLSPEQHLRTVQWGGILSKCRRPFLTSDTGNQNHRGWAPRTCILSRSWVDSYTHWNWRKCSLDPWIL